jgi:hypothetical protein
LLCAFKARAVSRQLARERILGELMRSMVGLPESG